MNKVVGIMMVAFLTTHPTAGDCSEKRGIGGAMAKVRITASPFVVWDVVHAERASDPDLIYSKVLERNGNKVVLEQKFTAMPIIGEAVCRMSQEETPFTRIDYSLMHSNKFKEMSGSWVLTEMPDGTTELQLCSTIDTGIPLTKGLIHMMLRDKLQKRLERIKKASEARAIAASRTYSGAILDSAAPGAVKKPEERSLETKDASVGSEI